MKDSGATLWEVMIAIMAVMIGLAALGGGFYLLWLAIQALQKYIAG